MSVFGRSYGSDISGELEKDGKPITIHTIPQAIEHGIAYATEDRKSAGLVLMKSINENITLAKMSKVSKRGTIDKDLEVHYSKEYRNKMNIKCSSVQQLAGNLSGGNQQKVLLSKWMFTDSDIMILDEPTRGIDVGAKYEIYCIINDLVAAGKSVIMISSELPEVLGICDRVYVMNEGKIVGELSREDASQEVIMGMILSASKGA